MKMPTFKTENKFILHLRVERELNHRSLRGSIGAQRVNVSKWSINLFSVVNLDVCKRTSFIEIHADGCAVILKFMQMVVRTYCYNYLNKILII